jgi:hypothetical protein
MLPRFLAGLGLGILAAVCSAGEIALYEYSDFMGRAIELRGPAPNLADLGFNDRAASIQVRHGHWEICTDAGFRGRCRVLAPGEYRQLPGDFNDAISSLREVVVERSQVIISAPPAPVTRVELFAETDFGGPSLQLTTDMPDLRRRGFDDVPASAVVHAGTWEFCTDPGFGGRCALLAPGRYPSLGRELSHRVSSLRPAAREVVRENYREPLTRPQPPLREGGQATLFEYPDFGGRGYTLRGNIPNFADVGFNDRAESLRVDYGVWEFCTDAHFLGDCRSFGPGEYRGFDRRFQRAISSARLIDDTPRLPRDTPNGLEIAPRGY